MFSEINNNKAYEITINDDNNQQQENNASLVEPETMATPAAGDAKDIKSETVEEKNKHLDQLLRLQAEFSNYKKRIEKEKLELSNLFKSELVNCILPVIDDLERMLDHTENNDPNHHHLLTGIKLIYQKLMEILEKQGLKAISALGQRFDPNLHEAVLIETVDNGDDGIVVEEWRKGYLFNNRLLRPSQVKVVKAEIVNEK